MAKKIKAKLGCVACLQEQVRNSCDFITGRRPEGLMQVVEFDPSDKTIICPTCKKPFPDHKVHVAKLFAREFYKFNFKEGDYIRIEENFHYYLPLKMEKRKIHIGDVEVEYTKYITTPESNNHIIGNKTEYSNNVKISSEKLEKFNLKFSDSETVLCSSFIHRKESTNIFKVMEVTNRMEYSTTDRFGNSSPERTKGKLILELIKDGEETGTFIEIDEEKINFLFVTKLKTKTILEG